MFGLLIFFTSLLSLSLSLCVCYFARVFCLIFCRDWCHHRLNMNFNFKVQNDYHADRFISNDFIEIFVLPDFIRARVRSRSSSVSPSFSHHASTANIWIEYPQHPTFNHHSRAWIWNQIPKAIYLENEFFSEFLVIILISRNWREKNTNKKQILCGR